MGSASYTVRDDDRYTVVVGWEDQLQTFFARVFARHSDDPIFTVGTRPGEIRAVSTLAEMVAGYASVDGDVVSALRHAAAPLA